MKIFIPSIMCLFRAATRVEWPNALICCCLVCTAVIVNRFTGLHVYGFSVMGYKRQSIRQGYQSE